MNGVNTQPQRGDRWLILAQLLAGVALVIFGALLAAFSRAALHDIGTAVIGIGATLVPAGVAASASSRIGQTVASGSSTVTGTGGSGEAAGEGEAAQPTWS